MKKVKKRIFGVYTKYLNVLLKKYDWADSVKEKLSYELDLIERKMKEKRLFLSIVGEFSCGKSTFINALLRDDLLDTANLGGTTLTATLICYSRKISITVDYLDGQRKTIFLSENQKKDSGEIKTQIRELTTNAELALKIKRVTVGHPAKFLKKGICIIDTPGTNAESWHENVTQKALREDSDVSLILTRADQPLPDTFCNFVHDNLSDVLNQSVFVATKVDMIPNREHKRLLNYISIKVQQEFEKGDLPVLPYSALLVLGKSNSRYRKEQNISLKDSRVADTIEASTKTETYIFKALKEKRTAAQLSRLLTLVGELFSIISKEAEILLGDYKNRYNQLEKVKKRKLSDFIADTEKHCIQFLESDLENVKNEIQCSYKDDADNQQKALREMFYACKDKEEMSAFVKQTFPLLLRTNTIICVDNARTGYQNLNNCTNNALREFWSRFDDAYQELNALNTKKTTKNTITKVAVKSGTYGSGGFMPFKISTDSAYENAGAGVGALIGTFILPGVGTAIGAFVGWLFGSFLSPDFSEFQKETWQKISPVIRDAYDKTDHFLMQEMDAIRQQIIVNTRDQINNCLNTYRKQVDTLIAKTEEEQRALNKLITKINQDQKTLADYYERLRALSTDIA